MWKLVWILLDEHENCRFAAGISTIKVEAEGHRQYLWKACVDGVAGNSNTCHPALFADVPRSVSTQGHPAADGVKAGSPGCRWCVTCDDEDSLYCLLQMHPYNGSRLHLQHPVVPLWINEKDALSTSASTTTCAFYSARLFFLCSIAQADP